MFLRRKGVKASTVVIPFILQCSFEDGIQSLLTGSCVFWNRLDTGVVKLQGWSKRRLKFGSCGKSQKSNNPQRTSLC